METLVYVLVIWAIIVNPVLGWLGDQLKSRRLALENGANLERLAEAVRKEIGKEDPDESDCEERAEKANRLVERLLSIIEAIAGQGLGDINIMNAGAGASIGQAAVGKEISQALREAGIDLEGRK